MSFSIKQPKVYVESREKSVEEPVEKPVQKPVQKPNPSLFSEKEELVYDETDCKWKLSKKKNRVDIDSLVYLN